MNEQINVVVFNFINKFAGVSSVLDMTMVSLAEYTPYFFILVLVYLWMKDIERKNIVLFAGYTVALGVALNRLISVLYFHPRPFVQNLGTRLVEHVPDGSFPSDHTTFVMSIALSFLYFEKTRKLGIVLSVVGLLSGLARVFVGVHFPFDIAGSLIVSFVMSLLVYSFGDKFKKLNKFLIDFYFKVTLVRKN